MSQASAALERSEEMPENPVVSFDYEREHMHRQMLSSVSHDLKTPLASIIGSLEVYTQMGDKLSAEKRDTLISVALQEARRLDVFITNVLDMAKLENGHVIPKPERVEIGTLVRHCVSHMKRSLREDAVDIEETSGPIKADIDPILLSRAICLVLDNASKYGGPSPAIRIEFGKNENRTGTISIRDKGPGLPKDCIEAVLEKYTRFPGENRQNSKGLGLGLPIAREIMRLLNGGITAANHPEGGAVFTLKFPFE